MRYYIENAISHIRHAGIANLMSLLSIALVTGTLITVLLHHGFIAQQLEFEKDAPTLIATLKDTLNETKGRAFLSQIEKDERILDANYISKQEVFERSEYQFKELGKLIQEGFTGIYPFPASIEIYIDVETKTQTMLEQLALDIKVHEEVEDVLLTAQGTWNERLRNAEHITIAAICMTIAACWLLIQHTLAKTTVNRHEEIVLVKLLGASSRYLLIPLLTHGIFLGILGTACGIAGFYGLFFLFEQQLGTLEFLPGYQYILIVGIGLCVGIVAAIFAQRKTTRLL